MEHQSPSRATSDLDVVDHDVLLVSMPFGSLCDPSIALGLLKAGLNRAGISCAVRYFTFPFAAKIGEQLYHDLANGKPRTVAMLGEWLFTEALWGPGRLDDDAYVKEVLRERGRGSCNDHSTVPPARDWFDAGAGGDPAAPADRLREDFIETVLRTRAAVASFLDDCVDEVMRRRPRILGFTSVFQQQIASLALASRVKQALPETFVLIGGANVEGVMGLESVRQFSFLDAAVSGEADTVFPQLALRVLAGEAIDDLPGVMTGRTLSLADAPSKAAGLVDLNALPYPDYDDYFQQLHFASGVAPSPVRVTFETSRGCWWGAKHHCTFCGLNGLSMAYRSKQPQRALDELMALSRRYPDRPISVVDNILDTSYFRTFLPRLRDSAAALNLFYEIKANVSKDQLRVLRDAGVTEVQPGIESLSSHVLQLMRKGVTMLQNIQTLKWCKELGVDVTWNVLSGFPGETVHDYEQFAATVPLLTHLQPPGFRSPIRLDRFSPYFEQAQQYGITNVRPHLAYRHLYDLPVSAIANLAYFFEFDYADGRQVHQYTAPLLEQLDAWTQHHPTSELLTADNENHLLVWDLRPAARRPFQVLEGLHREVLLACDRVHGIGRLQALAEQHCGPDALPGVLADLVDAGLLLTEDGHYLTLALPLEGYSPPEHVIEKCQAMLEDFGRQSKDGPICTVLDNQTSVVARVDGSAAAEIL
ncbi:RiPP maturation radical SAM C-methyltransferase [Mycobacterium sp.]|jgi:ribosomal peptide maturation radical SAM protein 1|uniref:RiPP maturation radical SAM C-methyltransferase n=1 Tax=Mycobacterium sp. TaxID=1785 RepID=UPI002D0E6FE2|nr:RiPP maturation radical SAM C-methyltransferase [Mycobacterium sp.]HXB89808.1 RiPP maturation radical SAM C-methyltransferase [Mycobacterium sp.]